MKKIREPQVAGMFYPSSKIELEKAITIIFNEVKIEQEFEENLDLDGPIRRVGRRIVVAGLLSALAAMTGNNRPHRTGNPEPDTPAQTRSGMDFLAHGFPLFASGAHRLSVFAGAENAKGSPGAAS